MYSPDKALALSLSDRAAFLSRAPTLGVVKRAYGDAFIESWIEKILFNISEFAGSRIKMNVSQFEITARLILSEYAIFKVTEFILFCQRFLLGRYGKFYGSVDPMTILDGMSDFAKDRIAALSAYKNEEARAMTAIEDNELEALRLRYIKRVPGAFTPEAPIDFLQYRLMGYDSMSDDDLKRDIEDIRSGRKTLPYEVKQILSSISAHTK